MSSGPKLVRLSDGVTCLRTAVLAGIPQPVLVPVPGTGLYRFAQPFEITLPDELGTLRVAAGMTTDGASIPRFFWRVVGNPFDPDFMAPAAGAHDPLYATHLLPRDVADRVFRKLMLQNSPRSARRAGIFWVSVRVGGWAAWHNYTPGTIAANCSLVTLTPNRVDLSR